MLHLMQRGDTIPLLNFNRFVVVFLLCYVVDIYSKHEQKDGSLEDSNSIFEIKYTW